MTRIPSVPADDGGDASLFFDRNAAVFEVLGPDEVLAVMRATDAVGCPACHVARAFFVLRRRDDTWTYLCVLCDRDERVPAKTA